MLHAIGHQVFYGNQFQVKFSGHFLKLRQPGHGAVLVEDFYQDARGGKPCQACEIYCGLGMAGSPEHPPVLGAEGEYMSGPAQLNGPGFRVYQGFDRL